MSNHRKKLVVIYPVECTYTSNPEDRKDLINKKLKIKISSKGLLIFDENGLLLKEFNKKIIKQAIPHPVEYPSFRSFEEPNLPQCASCNVYWPNDKKCQYCVLLSIKDSNEIYDKFEYALKFEDQYYRDAFLKAIDQILFKIPF